MYLITIVTFTFEYTFQRFQNITRILNWWSNIVSMFFFPTLGPFPLCCVAPTTPVFEDALVALKVGSERKQTKIEAGKSWWRMEREIFFGPQASKHLGFGGIWTPKTYPKHRTSGGIWKTRGIFCVELCLWIFVKGKYGEHVGNFDVWKWEGIKSWCWNESMGIH